MRITKIKLATILLSGFLILGSFLCSSGKANAQITAASVQVNPAEPNFFECSAAGTISVPDTFYIINVTVDSTLVYTSGKIQANGTVNILFDGYFGSGTGGTNPLYGYHSCKFECVVQDGFPVGLTYPWDITVSNQYFSGH